MAGKEFTDEITPITGETAAQTLLRQLNATVTEHNRTTGNSMSVSDGLCIAFSSRAAQ
jgi:hypothetical protein